MRHEDIIDKGAAAREEGAARSAVPMEIRAEGQHAIDAWEFGWNFADELLAAAEGTEDE